MTKKYLTLGLVITLVFSVVLVSASKPDLTTLNPSRSVGIPAHAIEVAPGIFSLGTAIDNGRVVEGYAIIRFVKPPWAGGPDNGDTSDCYAFLAKGVKWKTIEPYIVNPSNTRGLDETFIIDNLAVDIDKWEAAAGVDILGEGSSTSEDLVADIVSPDEKNEVYFADVEYEGAIAIAIIWGIFGGPPPFRELVEWDMIFDDVDFDWSATGEAGKMDFENIATHELGHSVGLDDLYTDICSEQTMYGYADYGETKKRTLEDGDINGISKLYK